MIVANELSDSRHLKHGFFTREGGHSTGMFKSLNCGLGSGDDLAAVQRNRNVVAGRLGVEDEQLLTLFQHHSADAVVVEEPWSPADRPRADAMVTQRPGIALGVLTADCGPVLFADPRARVIGAAHVGWKGALNGVTDNTVVAMEQLGARRDDIIAVIGPTISQRSYEVGPDFESRFETLDGENRRWFKPSPKAYHRMFDLPGYIAGRLRNAGLRHIFDLGLCTYESEARFFSYRRATHRDESDYGRQISAISLVD